MPKKERLNRDYYKGENAEHYSDSSWMAKNQLKTAKRAFELLNDDRIGGKIKKDYNNCIILDLGCGSGYSSALFRELGFKVIGLDYSFDMLLQNKRYNDLLDQEDQKQSITSVLINAQIEYLPFRKECFDYIISFSAFNFIFDGLKHESQKRSLGHRVVKQIKSVQKADGRLVIEFYPDDEDLNVYLDSFRNKFDGGLVIDNPGLRKEQKFLILKKSK